MFREKKREVMEKPLKAPDRNASILRNQSRTSILAKMQKWLFLDCGRANRRDTVQISRLGLVAAVQGPKKGQTWPLILTHTINIFIFNLVFIYFINEVQIFGFSLSRVPPARLFSPINDLCHVVLVPSKSLFAVSQTSSCLLLFWFG